MGATPSAKHIQSHGEIAARWRLAAPRSGDASARRVATKAAARGAWGMQDDEEKPGSGAVGDPPPKLQRGERGVLGFELYTRSRASRA